MKPSAITNHAIRRRCKFAGDDIEVARYYPEDEDFLLELEPHVVHHEVLEQHLK
jgi:hypothetical protein